MKNSHCNIPVIVNMRHHTYWWDVLIWLKQNVNKDCYDVDLYSFEHEGNPFNKRIWFANKQDAIIFALKWI